AFDLKDPSSCHQTYKLFDELHARIFGRPAVNADRIVLANDVYNLVVSQLDSMSNQLFGKYGLTRYLIVYLISEALEADSAGKELCKNPSQFLSEPNGRKRLNDVLGKLAASLIRILDGEVTRRGKTDETFFDYKSDLKSPKAVEALRATIISQYQIVVD